MVITAIFYYIFLPEDRSWMLSLPPSFIPSVAKLAILACITTISLCLTVCYTLNQTTTRLLMQ